MNTAPVKLLGRSVHGQARQKRIGEEASDMIPCMLSCAWWLHVAHCAVTSCQAMDAACIAWPDVSVLPQRPCPIKAKPTRGALRSTTSTSTARRTLAAPRRTLAAPHRSTARRSTAPRRPGRRTARRPAGARPRSSRRRRRRSPSRRRPRTPATTRWPGSSAGAERGVLGFQAAGGAGCAAQRVSRRPQAQRALQALPLAGQPPARAHQPGPAGRVV